MADNMQTIVVYHLDDEETPYRSKLRKLANEITLSDFKSLIVNPPKTYKYFFKSEDADFGVVKEEISDDKSRLPVLNGRIEAWLVSVDSSSAHSDTTPSSSLVPGVRGAGAAVVQKQHPTAEPLVRPRGHAGAAAYIRRQGQPVEAPSEVRRRFDEESACTSETESTIAGLPRISRYDHRLDRRSYRQPYSHRARPTSHPRNQQSLTTDLENTSFFESDDERGTRISYSTDITSVSRQYLKRRKKRRRLGRGLNSKMSEVSSVTESSASLNIITVVLNIKPGSYLGISIVGHSDYPHGDGGICVATIVEGGAVALDGRIEEGDMILQVNDIPFHNLSNDEAVQILQRVVKETGPVKLVVAKAFDANPRDYLDFRQCEPVRPIDPGAWVAHTNALLADPSAAATPLAVSPPPPTGVVVGGVRRQVPAPSYDYGGAATATGTGLRRPASAATGASSNNSGSFTATAIDEREIKLDINIHSKQAIVRAMARPDSGLEIKTRTWLKIEIPDAFMGSNLVDWLLTHVHGFNDRKEARKFASVLLKENYIKHSVDKYTFTEQCYYFISNINDNFANMRLGSQHEECALSEPDSLPPMLPPPPPSLTQSQPSTSWPSSSAAAGSGVIEPPPPSYTRAIGGPVVDAVVAAAAASSASGASGISSGCSGAGALRKPPLIAD